MVDATEALAKLERRLTVSRLGKSTFREMDADILAMRDAASALLALTEHAEKLEADVLRWAEHAGSSDGEVDILSARIEKALAGHVEGVAYADDLDEAADVPDDHERHFCHEDGEDWPCSLRRTLKGES